MMKTKSLLTTPSNALPLHLKQTVPPIIWIFNESEGDGIESRLPFKIFSTLLVRKNQSRFEGRPIRKPHHEIWIDFYEQKRWGKMIFKAEFSLVRIMLTPQHSTNLVVLKDKKFQKQIVYIEFSWPWISAYLTFFISKN